MTADSRHHNDTTPYIQRGITGPTIMSEPDELYTLRAQFWMGHYAMAMDEAKQLQRRPMSPALKAERDEMVQRCYIALGQYDRVAPGDSPGT